MIPTDDRLRQYVKGMGVIMLFWFVSQILIIFLVAGLTDWKFRTSYDADSGERLLTFLVFLLPFPVVVLGIAMAMKWFHQRPLMDLVSWQGTIRWNLMIMGLVIWGTLLVIQISLSGIFGLSAILLSPDFSGWLIYLILVLILVPIQTTAEELLFRGYLMEMVSKYVKKPWLLSVLTGLSFGALHFGYQSWVIVFVTGLMGVFLAYFSLKTRGLELVIGVHAINNLILFLLFSNSQVPGIPHGIFIVFEDRSNFLLEFLFVAIPIGVIIFMGWRMAASAAGTDEGPLFSAAQRKTMVGLTLIALLLVSIVAPLAVFAALDEPYRSLPREISVGDSFTYLATFAPPTIAFLGVQEGLLEQMIVEEGSYLGQRTFQTLNLVTFDNWSMGVIDGSYHGFTPRFRRGDTGAGFDNLRGETLRFPLQEAEWEDRLAVSGLDEYVLLEYLIKMEDDGQCETHFGTHNCWRTSVYLTSENDALLFRAWYSTTIGFWVKMQFFRWDLISELELVDMDSGDDSDGDGIFDKIEVDHGWDPESNDTDGDGTRDNIDIFPLADLKISLEFGSYQLDSNPDQLINGFGDPYVAWRSTSPYGEGMTPVEDHSQSGDFQYSTEIDLPDRYYQLANNLQIIVRLYDSDEDDIAEGEDDAIDIVAGGSGAVFETLNLSLVAGVVMAENASIVVNLGDSFILAGDSTPSGQLEVLLRRLG